jgi:4-amino-4-deoxy-L-arabinose transferase-like glycosyltransferase
MKRQATLFLGALIAGAAIWFIPWYWVRYALGSVLLWILPGLSWGFLIPRYALDRAERLAVGLGLSLAITLLATLLLTYLPGPLTRPSLIVAMVAVTGLPAVVAIVTHLRRKRVTATEIRSAEDSSEGASRTAPHHTPLLNRQNPLWRDGWAWLLAAILIATGLRVANLNYSEFQGDEATVMVRAARVLEGDEAAVFQHNKGPAELLLVMANWRLTGVTNEWMARLPFAWANVLGVAAVFLCGRRMGRPHAGGIAANLLAIEGFLVGFGRIVQYQSVVFALSALGLLCLFAYQTCGRGSLLIVAASLFAGGLLAHYDAVLAVPAGLLLVGARLWSDRRRIGRALVPVAVAAVVGGLLLASFYVPFLQSPYMARTSTYVSGRIGDDFYNHLSSSFELSAVYDSTYLLVVMLVALAGTVLITWARWGRAGVGLSCVLVVLAVSGLVCPQLWIVGQRTLAWIPFVLLAMGALLAPGQQASFRAVWLWLGLPALFYLFFVALPLTHIHTALPACALLAGVGLADLGRWLAGKSRFAALAARAAGVAIYVLCGFYAVMLFVDHTPEYLRTFPQFKNPLYWTPYEQMPEEGLFGFPHRAGWKTVGHLMNEGILAGTYDSNEEHEITDYYTGQAVRVHCASPDMYIVAANVQDEVPIRWEQIEREYTPTVIVAVGDRPTITVYERDALGPPTTYEVEEHESLFDSRLTPERVAWPVFDELVVTSLGGYVTHEAVLGSSIRLLGYNIDTRHAIPGGYVELTLFWQSMEVTAIDYHVFTHLHDGDTMRGQLDGQPVCGVLPTSEWEPGQIIVDPYRIPIMPEAPTGTVPLAIGMYDFHTMQRLPVSAPDGTLVGDIVHLLDVEIQSP